MDINRIISAQDKDVVAEAVRLLEKHTSGEIVPVIANRSGRYFSADLILGIIAGFLSVAVMYEFGGQAGFAYYMPVNFGGLLLGLVAARVPFIKRILVPEKMMLERVRKEALLAFYEQGLYKTRDKTGILIYVSLFERQVVVMGDEGINSKVSQPVWSDIVNRIIEGIKRKKYAEGLVEGIGMCRVILERNFPIKSYDTNELCNELVIINN
ncbi:MAG: TPM domain-containing protein [Oligoflexia bacterium]|nr:TPM domain-containing protein [Oligoflexia bacterium]